MIPRTYVETIVIPTLQEALADRGDRRRCYLACIAIYHVFDYLAGGNDAAIKDLHAEICLICGPTFEVVRGIANGAKHAGGARSQYIAPGSEADIKPFGLDDDDDVAGLDEGRWDYPGLMVALGDEPFFIDVCAQVLLLCLCAIHEETLGSVDLAFLDPDVLRGPPEPWLSYWSPGPAADSGIVQPEP